MKNSEIQDYWRWKLVRQVSTFINDPGEQNTQALLEMIETYPQINRNLESCFRIEPPAAPFVCTLDS